jgi:dTDP-4-dehydrorhamnose reductase
VETDPPNPLSAYGASKLAGELLLRAAWPKHYIVRTCGLYGLAGASGKADDARLRSSGNFVNTMLRLAAEGRPIRVVDDQTCTPTFTKDLAAQIALLIETEAYGTYHATNDGACTWYEFAREVFRLAGLSVDVQPVSSAAYGAPARRPPYSVLENCALKALGIDRMRPWQEALAEYVAMKARNGIV